ncbi:MAG: hypothetical protein AB1Z23_12265 [Eubacteriales bacterium]
MSFDWQISVGDIIAFVSLIGSIIMFVLTTIKQTKSKSNAEGASSFNDAAKKYYELMVDITPKLLNRTKVEEKKEKAECDAAVVRTGKSKWVIKIFNKGNSNANNVAFKYLSEDGPAIIGSVKEIFPIELIEPQKNVDYHFMVFMSTKSSSWKYELTWTNDDGTPGSKKGVITLPLT